MPHDVIHITEEGQRMTNLNEHKTPEIGDIVRYKLDAYERLASDPDHIPAIITRVWSDHCVNLTVFYTDGRIMGHSSVPLYFGEAGYGVEP